MWTFTNHYATMKKNMDRIDDITAEIKYSQVSSRKAHFPVQCTWH